MEYLDPKQKRSHLIKLYVGYIFMAVMIISTTWVLSSLSSGYYYDTKTKTVIQNGLLFVDSHPESSRVTINGQDKGKTDVRLVVPEGKYKINLSGEGYRDWNHETNIEGASIERLVYPFLFPANLKSEDSELFASKPSFASQSPDRNWIVIKYPDVINDFYTINVTEDPIFLIKTVLPTGVVNVRGQKHIFNEVEWSTDNKHVLIEHVFDDGSEFIIFDRDKPEKSFNINQQFKGRAISDVRLRDKKFDKFYLHNSANGELATVELGNPTITVVATGVLEFQPHGNDIVLYVARNPKLKDMVEVRLSDKDKHYVVRELPSSTRYLIDLAQFDGKWYVALGASEEKKVYIFINPFDVLKREKNAKQPLPTALLRLNKPIEFLSFSANARFIAVQGGSNFAVYDAETIRYFKYDSKLELTPDYEVKWMDGHRLNGVSQNKMFVFDFDGTNKQELVGAYNEFPPFFNRDYDKLFTISNSVSIKDRPALLFTPLKYEPEKSN